MIKLLCICNTWVYIGLEFTQKGEKRYAIKPVCIPTNVCCKTHNSCMYELFKHKHAYTCETCNISIAFMHAYTQMQESTGEGVHTCLSEEYIHMRVLYAAFLPTHKHVNESLSLRLFSVLLLSLCPSLSACLRVRHTLPHTHTHTHTQHTHNTQHTAH
jgi:hypothetical protein